MKFVILGAGATGGFLGARLARANADVTLVARGPHLEAMRANGVRVVGGGDDFVAHPACTDDLSVVGSADVVFLTVKAHALTDLAPRLGPLLGGGGSPGVLALDSALSRARPVGAVRRQRA